MEENELEALNDAGAETSDSESPAEEPETAPELSGDEEESVETTTEESESNDEDGEQVKNSKRSAQSRIQELNKRAKDAEEYAQSLEGRLKSNDSDPLGIDSQGLYPDMPDLKPGQELSVEEYQKHIDNVATSKADALVRMRLAEQQNRQRIVEEAREVMDEFPELNPKNKDAFDKELSESVTEVVDTIIKSNPNASVKQLVEKYMKPYKTTAKKVESETAKKVVKQREETALRPSGDRPQEKEEDLSLEEIERKVGVVNSY